MYAIRSGHPPDGGVRHPQHDQRPAVLEHRPDLLPERADLLPVTSMQQKTVLSSFHFSLKKEAPDRLLRFVRTRVGDLKSTLQCPCDERVSASTGRQASVGRTRRCRARAALDNGARRRIGQARASAARMLPSVSNLLRSYRGGMLSSASRFEHVKDQPDQRLRTGLPDSQQPSISAMHIYGDANRYLVRFPVGRRCRPTSTRSSPTSSSIRARHRALARQVAENKAVHVLRTSPTTDQRIATCEVSMQSRVLPGEEGW